MRLLKKILIGACMIALLGGLGLTQEVYAKTDTNIAPVLAVNYDRDERQYNWEVIGTDPSTTAVVEVEYTVNGESIKYVQNPGFTGNIKTSEIRDMFNSLPRELKPNRMLTVRTRVVDGDPAIDGKNWIDVSQEFRVSDLYCITLTSDENGTCVFSDVPDKTYKYVLHNEEVTVEANPYTGFSFDHYEVDGTVRSTQPTWTFRMVDDPDLEIKCIFTAVPTRTPTPTPTPFVGDVIDVSIYTVPETPSATDTSIKVYWNTYPMGTMVKNGIFNIGGKKEVVTKVEAERGYKVIPIDGTSKKVSLDVYDYETGTTLCATSNQLDLRVFKNTVITERSHFDYITAGYKLKIPYTIDGTVTDITWSCNKDATVEVYSGYILFSASKEDSYTVTATVKGGANLGKSDYTYNFRRIYVQKKPTIEFSDGKFKVVLPEKVNLGISTTTSSTSSSSSSISTTSSSTIANVTGAMIDVSNSSSSASSSSSSSSSNKSKYKDSGRDFSIESGTYNSWISGRSSLTLRIYPCDTNGNYNSSLSAACTVDVNKITITCKDETGKEIALSSSNSNSSSTFNTFYAVNGQSVSVTVTAPAGYAFKYWEDDKNNTSSSRTIIANGDKTYVAVVTSLIPTEAPTPRPTATPTAKPTATPTAAPTATPTAKPTATPTATPTTTPTATPTAAPTTTPTATPTVAPTAIPTTIPITTPSGISIVEPTTIPMTTSAGISVVEPTPSVAPTASTESSQQSSDDSTSSSSSSSSSSNESVFSINIDFSGLGGVSSSSQSNLPLKAAGTASAYDVIKQEQGIICKFMFNLSRPKGYTEAFTFNVSNGGKITNDLKNGALVLNIPTELRKPGRVFALIGINKYGATQLYTDADSRDDTFSTALNTEGYAFDLIYTDALTSTTNTTKSTVSSKKAK